MPKPVGHRAAILLVGVSVIGCGSSDSLNVPVSTTIDKRVTGPETDLLVEETDNVSAIPLPHEIADLSKPTLVGEDEFKETYSDSTIKRVWRAKVYSDKTTEHHGPYVEMNQAGKRVRQGDYVNGKRQGTWKFWHGNGQLAKQGSYQDNQTNGKWVYYRPDGTLLREEFYESGKQNGNSTVYAADGHTPVQQKEFRNGKKHGKWTRYFETGQIREQAHYENDKLHGNYKSWNEDGDWLERRVYQHGQRLP